MKKCTANDKEQLTCNCEKMGCEGCGHYRTKTEIIIIDALNNNNCTYENMSKYFTRGTLAVHVYRLRKKCFTISTIDNVGYRFKEGTDDR